MDQNLVYTKTPIGDDAVRNSTRVVQRNLRMVLVQVDGKLTVGELVTKIGNVKVVESALRELEEGGFIAPQAATASVWEESKRRAQQLKMSAASQFSGFGPNPAKPAVEGDGRGSAFSSFGKPILPTVEEAAPATRPAPEPAEIRPFNVKRLAGFAAVVMVLLVAAAVLFPYDRFRPEIESALSKVLQTPVHVGSVDLGFLPRPLLVASDIRIGDKGDTTIDQMRLPSPLSLLVSGGGALTTLQLSGVKVGADGLAGLHELTAPLALRRVSIERMTITAGDMALGDLAGEIVFLDNGRVEKALIQTVDRSLRFEAMPVPQGMLLKVEGFAWRPLAEMPVAFDALQAKGLLQRSKLVIESIDSTFMGGVLKGSWLVDWSNGLVMAGDASLSRLDTKRLASVFAPSLRLEGELAGSLHLRSAGQDWRSLWSNVEVALDAELTRGVFHGIDLGEVARRGSGYVVRSGSTRFAALRAEVNIDPRQFTARNLQLDAGIMTVKGQLSCQRDLSLIGDFVVSMQSSVTTLRMPVKVSGKLGELVAVSGH